MKYDKALAVLVAAVFGTLICGCNSISPKSVLQYVPEPGLASQKPLVGALFIEKMQNALPDNEMLPFVPNDDPWILIPLCFYSSQTVKPLVKRSFFQNDIGTALQRLFVKDLRASGLCKLILSADEDNPRVNAWGAKRYHLRLILKHARWNRNLTAYGLSYPGTLLWSLGAPTSFGDVEVEIDAVLYPPGADAKPIGKTTIHAIADCTEFIYDQIGYQPAKSEMVLMEMFPKLAERLRKFVHTTLKKRGEVLKF
ncbi:MAG: hypothetical protein GXP32_05165 [Kiritimatiellaeota bacterium]|nr:hypothetical protein [Kiritimatiellota bacterium]